jgi:hypothetical protein
MKSKVLDERILKLGIGCEAKVLARQNFCLALGIGNWELGTTQKFVLAPQKLLRRLGIGNLNIILKTIS